MPGGGLDIPGGGLDIPGGGLDIPGGGLHIGRAAAAGPVSSLPSRPPDPLRSRLSAAA